METARIYDAPVVAHVAPGWCHLAPSYDPRSGEGARIAGGRFNPPNSFPVLYLCLSRPCASAEFRRLAERQAAGIAAFLPRRVVRFDVRLDTVIDLCDRVVREHIEVELSELVRQDRTTCRTIGVAAHARGVQGLLSPSATGIDVVLALVPENLGAGQLEIIDEETWADVDDVDAATDV